MGRCHCPTRRGVRSVAAGECDFALLGAPSRVAQSLQHILALEIRIVAKKLVNGVTGGSRVMRSDSGMDCLRRDDAAAARAAHRSRPTCSHERCYLLWQVWSEHHAHEVLPLNSSSSNRNDVWLAI